MQRMLHFSCKMFWYYRKSSYICHRKFTVMDITPMSTVIAQRNIVGPFFGLYWKIWRLPFRYFDAFGWITVNFQTGCATVSIFCTLAWQIQELGNLQCMQNQITISQPWRTFSIKNYLSSKVKAIKSYLNGYSVFFSFLIEEPITRKKVIYIHLATIAFFVAILLAVKFTVLFILGGFAYLWAKH
jgi:hypothetical protein